jgi:hypothetical protein
MGAVTICWRQSECGEESPATGRSEPTFEAMTFIPFVRQSSSIPLEQISAAKDSKAFQAL